MSDPWTRRRYLSAAATAVVASLGLAAAAGADNDRTYVIEQDGECVPVVPINGDEPVEAFYRWGKSIQSWSSEGTRELQRSETSLLCLYDGPEGLSLVIVHDAADDGTPGGRVSFEIAGVPADATWAVKDDLYDRTTNVDTWEINGTVLEANETTVTDEFTDFDDEPDADDNGTDSDGNETDGSDDDITETDVDDATASDRRTDEIDWWWTTGRTDGGALRGLGVAGLELRIEPAFNDEAELAATPNEGEITSWELLSGDRDDPERTALDLDEPLTLRTGTCGDDGSEAGTESTADSAQTATASNATETGEEPAASDDDS